MPSVPPFVRRRSLPAALALPLLLAGCGSGDAPSPDTDLQQATPAAAPADPGSGLVQLLADGQAVFGVFSGDQTRAQGASMVGSTDADFILYSMERPPFDVPRMAEYIAGILDAGGAEALRDHPVVLRTPAIHAEPDEIGGKVASALETPIAGIVFPHVTTAAEAAQSYDLMPGSWPGSADGSLLNILIVEDQEGIANVREIMATPGLSVVFAGPGDLRRAYDGDMEAVENAIQAVLSACLEFDVACGVTAGVADIAERLDQGFRMIIVSDPEAVAVGKEAAGRTD
jgi:2-keto-3-deoxy-L-rhamnonate aldolase RhmA